MFENIGGKIKTTAVVVTVIGIIASVIGGIAIMAAHTRYNPTIFTGIGFLVGGCVGSWVGSFVLYGFGQMIEDLQECKGYLYTLTKNNDSGDAPKIKSALLAGAESTKKQSASSMPAYPWICDRCGARNSSSASVCRDCGEQHITAAKTPHAVPAPPVSQPAKATTYSEWKCPKCGYLNPAGQLSCKSCGEYI